MLRRLAVAICFGTLVCGAEVFAQTAPKVFVSPNKGQSQDQQNRDTADCQQWATQQAPPSQPASGAGTHSGAPWAGPRAARRRVPQSGPLPATRARVQARAP